MFFQKLGRPRVRVLQRRVEVQQKLEGLREVVRVLAAHAHSDDGHAGLNGAVQLQYAPRAREHSPGLQEEQAPRILGDMSLELGQILQVLMKLRPARQTNKEHEWRRGRRNLERE